MAAAAGRLGNRATVIDLYELVAAPQDLAAHELPAATPRSLVRRTMAQTWLGFAVTAGSERPRVPLVVADYDPAWPKADERWRRRVAAALGRTAIRIEYVGSTSVPGLAAKPIVDIQVSVADLGGEPRYVPPLQATGLVLRSRDELHRFLRPPEPPRHIVSRPTFCATDRRSAQTLWQALAKLDAGFLYDSRRPPRGPFDSVPARVPGVRRG